MGASQVLKPSSQLFHIKLWTHSHISHSLHLASSSFIHSGSYLGVPHFLMPLVAVTSTQSPPSIGFHDLSSSLTSIHIEYQSLSCFSDKRGFRYWICVRSSPYLSTKSQHILLVPQSASHSGTTSPFVPFSLSLPISGNNLLERSSNVTGAIGGWVMRPYWARTISFYCLVIRVARRLLSPSNG